MQIAVENCLVLGRPLAVLGSQAKRILPKVPKNSQVVINRRWREGQLSSLIYGHPVIVSAALRPEFFEARTAREVIYRVPERLRILDVRTSSVFEDFNSQDSYELCLCKFKARKSK